MKKYLIAGIVAVAVALVAVSANAALTRNLSVGSTGADVAELQTFLISKGFSIPAISSGVAVPGYFGSQTKAAVMAYQAANGIPSTGFFGPLTMASVNAKMGGVVGGGAVCPVGFTCTPTGPVVNCPIGFICTPIGGGTPVTGGGITTPGVEGTISATQSNAGLASTAYEGDDMVAILGFEVEAKSSDIRVERVKLRMDETKGGTDTKGYNKIYQKVYLTDGSTVLASSDLNTGTVVKDGSNYYITLAGFNWILKKDTKKTLTIKADLYENIDSADFNTETYQIGLATNGIRGVDGAGIDQFAGGASDNTIARTTTIATTLTESATLTVSLDTSSVKKNDVVAAAGGAEDELDKLTLATIALKAEKDDVKITTIYVGVTDSGSGGADAATAYLFDADTGEELGNATITSDVAIFTSFDKTITKDTTKKYLIKTDIDNATGVITNFVSSTTAAGIVAENQKGDTVTVSGATAGNSIGVRNRGPEITLISKSVTSAGSPQNNGTTTNVSTSTITANFTFKVKAVGGSVNFGLTQATGSPFFASTTPALGGAKSFTIYINGTENTTIGSYATSTSFSFDSGCTVVSTTACTLSEGATALVTASVALQGRSETAVLPTGLYSFGVNSLNWGGTNSTFMDDETDWITNEVSFP